MVEHRNYDGFGSNGRSRQPAPASGRPNGPSSGAQSGLPTCEPVIAWDEWAAAAGLNGVGIPGDVNGDGIIDEEDTRLWKLPKPDSVPLTDFGPKQLPPFIRDPKLVGYTPYGQPVYDWGGGGYATKDNNGGMGQSVVPANVEGGFEYEGVANGTVHRLPTTREWAMRNRERFIRERKEVDKDTDALVQDGRYGQAVLLQWWFEAKYWGERVLGTQSRQYDLETPTEKWIHTGADIVETGTELVITAKVTPRGRTPRCPKQKITATSKVVKHHQTPTEVLKQLPEDVANNPAVRGKRGMPNRRSVLETEHKRIHKGKGGGPANELTKQKIRDLGREPTPEDILRIREEVNQELNIKYED